MTLPSIILGLFFLFSIGMFIFKFFETEKTEEISRSISGAPFWVIIIWGIIAELPYQVRKTIYIILLFLCSILFGALFVRSIVSG
ncbi:hypothetical protein AAGS61_15245 [Lysinibacillus sp. KU-BSD001]|uniref:hypothetical protein n=1 Tax=Lysinibacillus sp. KU-BSD001 TaxID=3141328 RepID=UPI0036EF6158